KEYVTKDQRRNVNISILLPIHYIHKLECDVLPTSMSVSHIHSDSIEFMKKRRINVFIYDNRKLTL
ncbi:MAG: hypothetical protein U0N70_08140, partial [Catenibacterium sp.]|uniref:hypothetical protein n=1 Tax=Catenibacterium sp. TaxID=2049022 RepID=UPI002F952E44